MCEGEQTERIRDNAASRDTYGPALSRLLGRRYEKNQDLYDELKPRQETAIRNARRLHEDHHAGREPEESNPCTAVYLLVEELNRHLR